MFNVPRGRHVKKLGNPELGKCKFGCGYIAQQRFPEDRLRDLAGHVAGQHKAEFAKIKQEHRGVRNRLFGLESALKR